jgi:hypothetical protein
MHINKEGDPYLRKKGNMPHPIEIVGIPISLLMANRVNSDRFAGHKRVFGFRPRIFSNLQGLWSEGILGSLEDRERLKLMDAMNLHRPRSQRRKAIGFSRKSRYSGTFLGRSTSAAAKFL